MALAQAKEHPVFCMDTHDRKIRNNFHYLPKWHILLLVIIEFANTIEPRNHSAVASAIVITASALFFIPTTLIILGYYSSQPTGSLVSPLPQEVLSQQQPVIPTPTASAITVTPAPEANPQPIIAAPNESSESANPDVSANPGSNIVDKTATINPGETKTTVTDPDITESSQIYLSPRPGDKTIYSLGSKTVGSFAISVQEASDSVRYLDYHIVNP